MVGANAGEPVRGTMLQLVLTVELVQSCYKLGHVHERGEGWKLYVSYLLLIILVYVPFLLNISGEKNTFTSIHHFVTFF